MTGNLEPIGWGKMEALGISDLFSPPRFGGFGSDFCSGDTDESWRDRAELVRIAARRGEQAAGGAALGPRFHVGDAPMDVQAAAEAGAQAVGVATGIFTEAELRGAEKSAVVVPDLCDMHAVLRVLGVME